MREICQSGSEGGAELTFVPTPISAQGFNSGLPDSRAIRPEGALDERSPAGISPFPRD